MIATTEQIHDHCTENPPEAMYLFLVWEFVDLFMIVLICFSHIVVYRYSNSHIIPHRARVRETLPLRFFFIVAGKRTFAVCGR